MKKLFFLSVSLVLMFGVLRIEECRGDEDSYTIAQSNVYICKYCGRKAQSINSLTSFSDRNSPTGRCVPYEGMQSNMYVCKYCGRKAQSINSLTSFPDKKSPTGRCVPY